MRVLDTPQHGLRHVARLAENSFGADVMHPDARAAAISLENHEAADPKQPFRATGVGQHDPKRDACNGRT